LTGLSLWIRNDTIGFALAGTLIIGMFATSDIKWRQAGIFLVSALLPFVIWTLYLKLKIQTDQGSRFVDHMGAINMVKLKVMMGYVLSYFSWIQYGTMAPGIQLYGLTFMLSFLVVILNIKNIRKDKPYILIFLLVSFAVYFAIFYLIDEHKQDAPISSLMESSFKRGMFCFIPPLLFYVSTSTVVTGLMNRIEVFRTGKETAPEEDISLQHS
jgi:MFS family permease